MQPQIEKEERRRGKGGLHQISITYTLVGEKGGGRGTVLCVPLTQKKKSHGKQRRRSQKRWENSCFVGWELLKTVKFATITLYVYAKRNVPGLKYGNENFRLGCPSGRVKYPSLSLSLDLLTCKRRRRRREMRRWMRYKVQFEISGLCSCTWSS